MSSLISLLLLLLLLLSLSVTACTGARLLIDAHTKLGAKSVDVKKVRLLKPLLPEEKPLQQVDGRKTSNINGGTLQVGATVEKKNTKDSESLSAKADDHQVKEETNTISGHEFEMSPSGVGFQEATKLEGGGRRLGTGSNIVGSVEVAVDEESRESSRSDFVPGVFSRDYEQPQRKPPIHN